MTCSRRIIPLYPHSNSRHTRFLHRVPKISHISAKLCLLSLAICHSDQCVFPPKKPLNSRSWFPLKVIFLSRGRQSLDARTFWGLMSTVTMALQTIKWSEKEEEEEEGDHYGIVGIRPLGGLPNKGSQQKKPQKAANDVYKCPGNGEKLAISQLTENAICPPPKKAFWLWPCALKPIKLLIFSLFWKKRLSGFFPVISRRSRRCQSECRKGTNKRQCCRHRRENTQRSAFSNCSFKQWFQYSKVEVTQSCCCMDLMRKLAEPKNMGPIFLFPFQGMSPVDQRVSWGSCQVFRVDIFWS